MTKFIKLTEIAKVGEDAVRRPVLFNPAFIVGVSHGEFHAGSVFLVGETKTETVSLIQLSVGRPILVQETLEEILAAVEALEAVTKINVDSPALTV